jgi:hypothetical protein
MNWFKVAQHNMIGKTPQYVKDYYSFSEEPDDPQEALITYKAETKVNFYKKSQKAKEEGVTEKDVDPKELEMGIKVELEHTDSKEEAKTIALDHLAEFSDYYTRLLKMEEEAKAEKEK